MLQRRWRTSVRLSYNEANSARFLANSMFLGTAESDCLRTPRCVRDGMATLRDFFELLDESQWWPREKMVAWQRQQLHFLLNHARASTPYYKFRLNSVFRRDGTIDWDKWHKIPIVRRTDLLEHFDAMLSRSPLAQHGPLYDNHSSGSTGHPVKVRVTEWLLETSSACGWRAHRWAGLDWSKTLLSTQQEFKTWSAGDDIGPWGPPWLEGAQRGRRIYSHYGTPHLERLRLLVESHATYHAGIGQGAGRLAELARGAGLDLHVDTFLLRGGEVSDLLRSDLRETFGANVLEFYSSKECGAIAVRCPFGHGYHVNAEAVLAEIVDAQGLPVAPGQAGRVVITPFASTALPLIRYDQGDVAVAGTTCECGRSLPHIASISGRERTFFRHPDGRKAISELTQECRELIGAGQVQIAQVGPTEFEIRYTQRDWGVARDEAKFAEKFREIMFEDSNATLIKLPEIPLSPAGKFLPSVVEWNEDGAAARA
jgi:phenylacetate-CoA ligase